MNELISIIVPVYNVEKYLARCLDSLISQTYKKLEIILVDDGSPDSSGAICDAYKEADCRIKVIHQANGGQSKARNEAMKIATGKYFCFVDSDDYVSPNYIERLYELLRCSNADMSMCGYTMFTGESADGAFDNPASVELTEYSGIKLIEQMHTVYGELYVVMWGKLFKKSIVENITFPEGRICEDIAVLYRIYDRVNKAVCSNEIMYYYYRNNKNSSTYTINRKFYDDVFMALDEEIEYMEDRHPDMCEYPKKTYMYWLFDYCRNLYNRGEKTELKAVHNKFRQMYKGVKNLDKEKFYKIFFYAPKFYLKLKSK